MEGQKQSEASTFYSESLGISLNRQDKDTSKNAINQLKNLFIADKKKRFPNVPDFAIVAPEYKDTSTNGLTKCVYDHLALNGYFVERTGNEGRIIDDRKEVIDCIGRHKTIGTIKRIRSSGTSGTSDLKAIIKGQFIAIEIKCKATNDRIRPDQIKYKLQVEKSGGVYIIASTFQQFYEWFNSFIREGKQ